MPTGASELKLTVRQSAQAKPSCWRSLLPQRKELFPCSGMKSRSRLPIGNDSKPVEMGTVTVDDKRVER